jgi:hypothetical protein
MLIHPPTGFCSNLYVFESVRAPGGSYIYGNRGHGPAFATVRSEGSGESFLIHFAWLGSCVFDPYNVHDPPSDDA